MNHYIIPLITHPKPCPQTLNPVLIHDDVALQVYASKVAVELLLGASVESVHSWNTCNSLLGTLAKAWSDDAPFNLVQLLFLLVARGPVGGVVSGEEAGPAAYGC